jgi:single-strand DNA-binding protein
MPNYATATIVGHLGRDCETKSVGERTVINFTIAVSRKVKDVESTTWWRVAYWTKSANFAQYLAKGTPVLVTGEPYQREYEAKDGTKKLSLELDAKDVKLMGGKPEAAAPQKPSKPAPGTSDGTDEPPFSRLAEFELG